MVNWLEIPDLAAVALLASAFASVSRRNQTPVSRLWLTGWIMIVLHFAAFTFLPAPGIWGILAANIGLAALIWAGLLFMWASVPDRHESYSRWMLAALLLVNTLYIVLISADTAPAWALNTVAVLLGGLPLAIAVVYSRKFNHPMRRGLVALYCALSIFLLLVQHRPGNGADLAQNALLFTVYFACCIHFWHMYRRGTAGAFVTIAGFLAWSLVFVVAPAAMAFLPQVHIEGEVWNLPKYVVAVGMILLLLEDQIEHNEYLALHDMLTALPNRRLFQDRLGLSLERARREGTQTALMVIDLDGFKEVNDTLGHHVGDLLLQRVGSIFSGRVRGCDTVARTGGDEFSVILEENPSRQEAMEVSEALMELLIQPQEIEGHTVTVGASVGVALFPEDASDMQSLCIKADLRMYEVKHSADHQCEPWALESPIPQITAHSRTAPAYELPIMARVSS
jgi:diguanylate cyclase (GGDEF)-like protein